MSPTSARTLKKLSAGFGAEADEIPTDFRQVWEDFFAAQVLESDRRLKTGFTRSPAEQLQEIIVRQARKTRDR